ncbi:MAG: hypothetical protein NTZ65_01110 [Candidatus Berkelbacteria bacterium]|nr:hypothetical protein [Candidatus Berkelbacteria bacterium]
MRENKYIPILIFAIAGVWLRWYLIHTPGYVNDINSFLAWGNQIKDHGFWSLYSKSYSQFLDYPPLIPLITSWWMRINIFSALTTPQFFKVLPTMAEIALLIITALFVIRSKVEYKSTLLAVIFLQPGMALVTSSWGQVDAILVLVLILGFVVMEANLFVATFLMFLGLLIKPQAILGLLVFGIFIFAKHGFIKFLKQLGFLVVLVAAVALIFKFHNGNFFSIYLLSTSRYQYLSVNAFNIWWLMNGSKSFGLSDVAAKPIGMALFAAFLIPGVYYLIKKASKLPQVFLVLSYVYLIFFVFPTEIHERYLYPAVVFAAIAAILSKRIFGVYLILSATLFLNCYAVLQTIFPQFQSVIPISGNLLAGNWTIIVAAANVLVAIYLSLYLTNEVFKRS